MLRFTQLIDLDLEAMNGLRRSLCTLRDMSDRIRNGICEDFAIAVNAGMRR